MFFNSRHRNILSNIPTSFYLNYPDSSKEPMTKASLENFAESGLLSNSNEILIFKNELFE